MVVLGAWPGLGCLGPSEDEASRAEPAASPGKRRARIVVPPPQPASPAPKPAAPRWQPRPGDRVTPHQSFENDEALAPFYDRLAALDDGNESGLVRVLHLGDSVLGADGITTALRRRFQTRFGDGGAGLVLWGRYMLNYRHNWVKLESEGWEHCFIPYLCKRDGRYGLGGTTFWSDGGAKTTISTRTHELGGEVAHFEVWYLAGPRGGRLEIRVDRDEPVVLNTRAEQVEDRYHVIDVEPGPHKIRLRARGGGRTRGYGVVLESAGPGVVWDGFSMLGAFTKRLLALDEAHIAGQMRQRNADLLVLSYGGNDLRRVVIGKVDGPGYTEEYVKVVQHLRAGTPDVPCLMTALPDHARIFTYDVVPAQVEMIVNATREAARRAGCAFFDTYAAMGGGGSMQKWRRKSPPLASEDLKHLNHRGVEVVGGWIYDALIAGYVQHRRSG